MIDVRDFTKKYGSFTAVENISFSVKRGEVFAFLGPNGSGKTTTMKSMVGLVVPTGGTVLVDGQDVQRSGRDIRRRIAYLPQRVVFPETQTAREILRFYCQVRRLPSERVDEALHYGNFNGFAERPVGEFSGGMIQRLGLAVVQLSDAPILLLDEPTANLDPHGVKRFREFVRTQKANGKTVVFSTHLLDEAEQLADRVGIFVGGHLAAEESIEDLRRTRLVSQSIEDVYLHYVNVKDAEQ